MTISKKDLQVAFERGKEIGVRQGKQAQEAELQTIRKSAIIELVNAASNLAQANAKLTYAMSRITDKLL